MYNSNEEIKEINGIQVEEKNRYLGVTIDNKKELFESHKLEIFNRAKIFSNMMYYVTGKCVK